MWEYLFGPIFRVFAVIWTADERPAARWFTVGCLVMLLAVIGILALIYAG